jgi:hypothetical protein
MNYKIHIYKFQLTNKKTGEIKKYRFVKDITNNHGMSKGSIYNLINGTHDKKRKKYADFEIQHISEPFIFK